ncbi:MAG: maleylpyruvate isomerase family mycothiol-dependent enzyme [Marmoricola sp.]
MTDLWGVVAAERGSLAEDLAGLSEKEWRTRSLCTQWNVEQVLAHMTATGTLTAMSFFGSFAGAGFNFNTFATRQIAKHRGSDPAETLAGFRAVRDSTKSPPGPKESWLGEAIVHAEDIRRPLGIRHDYPVEALRQVADFYKGSNALIGTKSRIAGLSLHATDVEWNHGEGDQVSGPMLSVLMAMTGRGSACDQLEGPGVEKLRAAGGGPLG